MVSCDSFQKCKPHTIDQGDEYGVNHSLNFVWKDFPNSENLSAQTVNAQPRFIIHYCIQTLEITHMKIYRKHAVF